MYYRYSTKKKFGSFYKVIVFLALTGVILFFAYKYKEYLIFWKYDLSKIEKDYNKCKNINNLTEKIKKIKEVISETESYISENINSHEAYIINAKSTFLLAEIYYNRSFTNDIIFENNKNLLKSQNYFIKTIKSIKKAIALDSENIPPDKILLILMKSYFFTKYYSFEDMKSIFNKIRSPENLKSSDDKRFYSYLKIINGNEDSGLEFLIAHGDVNGTIEGRMFLGECYLVAKKYSKALLEYQGILVAAPDDKFKKEIYIKIGDIYNKQLLLEESVNNYLKALSYDRNNHEIIKKIIQTYNQLGNKKLSRKFMEFLK